MTLPELPEATEVDGPARLATRTSAHWGLVVALGAAAVAIFVGLAFWVGSVLPETQERGTECFLHDAQACRTASETEILSAVEDRARISFPEGTQLVQSESSGGGARSTVDRSALVRVPEHGSITLDTRFREVQPGELPQAVLDRAVGQGLIEIFDAQRLSVPSSGSGERLPEIVVLEGPTSAGTRLALIDLSEVG
ncbi:MULTISPECIES: hypothetical protein [unclassified Leucobacter]|uniref:hypothetical protein n=1 Tax=unclassified Leucobacter TaxID=2621730 RepID=UPI00062179F5|nr:hypothetical protein [Leucobacter sp. Ag1]KKI16719.1 hypothetical protein XM48_13890 [Leucobacter sp. Ag1]